MEIPQDEKGAKIAALRQLMGVAGTPVLTIKICLGEEGEEKEMEHDQSGDATDMVMPEEPEKDLY